MRQSATSFTCRFASAIARPASDRYPCQCSRPISRIAALPRLRSILCLGGISHQSVVRALGGRVAAYKFAHGARHDIAGLTLWDSYHCSRYNTNTGRLTPEMFEAVFAAARREFDC